MEFLSELNRQTSSSGAREVDSRSRLRQVHIGFHASSGECATLIGYDDVALGGRQIGGHIGEKNP
jgi:hypothetical protein